MLAARKAKELKMAMMAKAAKEKKKAAMLKAMLAQRDLSKMSVGGGPIKGMAMFDIPKEDENTSEK